MVSGIYTSLLTLLPVLSLLIEIIFLAKYFSSFCWTSIGSFISISILLLLNSPVRIRFRLLS